jgi:hypothetical protein
MRRLQSWGAIVRSIDTGKRRAFFPFSVGSACGGLSVIAVMPSVLPLHHGQIQWLWNLKRFFFLKNFPTINWAMGIWVYESGARTGGTTWSSSGYQHFKQICYLLTSSRPSRWQQYLPLKLSQIRIFGKYGFETHKTTPCKLRQWLSPQNW